MIKQVFIGGHFSSGTRVVQFLLRQTHNIFVREVNEQLDYEFEDPHIVVGRLLSGGRDMTTPKKPFSLKAPDFMLIFDKLKEIRKGCKTILVVRNGIDQILCSNRCMSARYNDYLGPFKEVEFFRREMEYWNALYKRSLENGGIDLILRLEDLVEDTEKSVKKLVKLLKIPYPDTSMIKRPDTMGARFREQSIGLEGQTTNFYKLNVSDIPPLVRYAPSRMNELYEVGKEMMDYFGYGI